MRAAAWVAILLAGSAMLPTESALAGKNDGPAPPPDMQSASSSSSSSTHQAVAATSSSSSSASSTSQPRPTPFTADDLRLMEAVFENKEIGKSDISNNFTLYNDAWMKSITDEQSKMSYGRRDKAFFQKGESSKQEGWKLHISLPYDRANGAATEDTFKALAATLNTLRGLGVTHKFVFPGDYPKLLTDRVSTDGGTSWTPYQEGKFVTIYPKDEEELRTVAQTLRAAMYANDSEFNGLVQNQPGRGMVMDHVSLHGDHQVWPGLPIYMRYGTFQGTSFIDIPDSSQFDENSDESTPDEVLRLALGDDFQRYPDTYKVQNGATTTDKNRKGDFKKLKLGNWRIDDDYLKLFRVAPAFRENTRPKVEILKDEDERARAAQPVRHAAESSPTSVSKAAIDTILKKNAKEVTGEDIANLINHSHTLPLPQDWYRNLEKLQLKITILTLLSEDWKKNFTNKGLFKNPFAKDFPFLKNYEDTKKEFRSAWDSTSKAWSSRNHNERQANNDDDDNDEDVRGAKDDDDRDDNDSRRKEKSPE
ncbi:MAG: hypothetical protein JSS38_08145 [Nitrospira sp.]|nr:hypothetical protein [Nitrospira sp.]